MEAMQSLENEINHIYWKKNEIKNAKKYVFQSHFMSLLNATFFSLILNFLKCPYHLVIKRKDQNLLFQIAFANRQVLLYCFTQSPCFTIDFLGRPRLNFCLLCRRRLGSWLRMHRQDLVLDTDIRRLEQWLPWTRDGLI